MEVQPSQRKTLAFSPEREAERTLKPKRNGEHEEEENNYEEDSNSYSKRKAKKNKKKKYILPSMLSEAAAAPREKTKSVAWIILNTILWTSVVVVTPSLIFRDEIVSTLLFWRPAPSDARESIWALHDTERGIPTNTVSEHVSVNTTTVQELLKIRESLLWHAKKLPCVCMHHLRFQQGVSTGALRVCAVHNEGARQTYFMRNPRIIGFNKGAELVKVRERSISCRAPLYPVKSGLGPSGPHGNPEQIPITVRPRASGVFVEWEDEFQVIHYALFREERAYCLQLAADEFVGDKHCPPQEQK